MDKCKAGDRVVVKTILGDFETTCLQVNQEAIAINISDLFGGLLNWTWIDRKFVRPVEK